MISLRRPPEPNTLQKRAPDKTRTVVTAVLSDWEAYSRVKRPLKASFSGAVYGAKDVRETLFRAQNGKCAYCEHPIGAAQSGDVEHFRPKGACQQAASDKLTRPGYFWLAYAWSNLLLACSKCNGSPSKGNRFPLADNGRRARRPQDSLQAERALLLNPYDDAPSDHLTWSRHDPRPRTPRGKASIAVYRLDREQLREARMKRIDEVDVLLRLLMVLRRKDEPTEQYERLLPQFIGPQAPFQACVRAACAELLTALDV